MSELFNTQKQQYQPLADALRPKHLEEIVGQDHLLGGDGILSRIAKSKQVPSLILWGSAGCGKTTIAKILAGISGLYFEMLSATNSGAADLRKVFKEAAERKNQGLATILMIDEIHRFNRSQQDLFLPYIEDGTIILIGATTQNPSFELNSALLSRCRVITLNPLNDEALDALISKAQNHLERDLLLSKEARERLVKLACGDGRYLLNLCEEIFNYGYQDDEKPIDVEQLGQLLQKKMAIYDKDKDGHYGLISALHKAMRGSDVDAALYYLARMLSAGEEPHYLLRRIARFASEDIGMADPNALVQVMAAKESYDFLGSPEGDYAISNAVIYCATAPKSNASYIAHKAAMKSAKEHNSFAPPKHILNAPTKMMKEQGYNAGYIYDHDTKDCFSGQEYFPAEFLKKEGGRPQYYAPNNRGFEREITKRLEYWQKLRRGS
ncbi:MAG: replication-associated recombination protein A [Proteobacteria bacterium]|nr:replication-associated recombination protein A [Pseudomonadota bacterium]